MFYYTLIAFSCCKKKTKKEVEEENDTQERRVEALNGVEIEPVTPRRVSRWSQLINFVLHPFPATAFVSTRIIAYHNHPARCFAIRPMIN